tara:strand:- start:18184 stop:18534 length:351 start_codon:yes stop_codon:yes gene_type:complete
MANKETQHPHPPPRPQRPRPLSFHQRLLLALLLVPACSADKTIRRAATLRLAHRYSAGKNHKQVLALNPALHYLAARITRLVGQRRPVPPSSAQSPQRRRAQAHRACSVVLQQGNR